MPEIKTCSDGHEEVAYFSRNCPVCLEQDKVLIAREKIENLEKERQDIVDKIKALWDGL